MEKLNTDHRLFAVICAEHNMILEKLKQRHHLENLVPLIEWLWIYNENGHHFKEETILFQDIAKHPRACEGGPLCTYFFDEQMREPPLDRVKKITGNDAIIEEHQAYMISTNSPVRIPLDEHRAGKELLRHCRQNHLSGHSPLSHGELLDLLHLYEKIQITHFAKEEHCFFHLCTNLLTVSDADLMLKKWLGHRP